MLRFICWLAIGGGVFAQPAGLYKTVARASWVVDNLDKTVAGWQKAGIPLAAQPAILDFKDSRYRGKPIAFRARVATGIFANVRIDWIEPLDSGNAYADFLKSHGPGIFSLMHQAPTDEVLQSEVKRLANLGVSVLQETLLGFDGEKVRVAYLDTIGEGKYSLGLIWLAEPEEAASTTGPPVTQFAFTARKLEPISRYWEKLGFPPFSYSHPDISDKVFRSKPGSFDMRLGWQREGHVPYEWIEPLAGPSVYDEHLARYGDGAHHIAFNVPQIDEASRRWEGLGFPLVMSGAWGEKGKPGSGRFAYHDTHSIGGLDIELLWNYKP